MHIAVSMSRNVVSPGSRRNGVCSTCLLSSADIFVSSAAKDKFGSWSDDVWAVPSKPIGTCGKDKTT